MNRSEALEWAAKNVNGWPTAGTDYPVGKFPKPVGWEWRMCDGHEWCLNKYVPAGKAFVGEIQIITYGDWLSERNRLGISSPPPSKALTRDEALAWVVENVKDWPAYGDTTGKPKPEGWMFVSKRDPERVILKHMFSMPVGVITHSNWEAAKAKPAEPALVQSEPELLELTDQVDVSHLARGLVGRRDRLLMDTLNQFERGADLVNMMLSGVIHAIQTPNSFQLWAGDTMIIEVFDPSITYDRSGEVVVKQNYRVGDWEKKRNELV